MRLRSSLLTELEAEVIRNLSERKENEEAGQKPPIKERQTAD